MGMKFCMLREERAIATIRKVFERQETKSDERTEGAVPVSKMTVDADAVAAAIFKIYVYGGHERTNEELTTPPFKLFLSADRPSERGSAEEETRSL